MRSGWLIVAALVLQAAGAPLPRARVLAESIPGAVPAGFAADLLIRVAESPAASKEPVDWRADAYEQAFELARFAPHQLPLYPRRDPRVRIRIDPIGPAERLDALSLQVRAFNALLAIRHDRALELAATLDVRVPVLACGDLAVPNPAGIFDIARHDYALLERQVLSVQSSTQLAPAFEAILEASLRAPLSRGLLTSLANTMRSLDDDDVSFTDTLGPTWAAVKHAIDSGADASFSAFVLDAFRSYLVLHLSGPRCQPARSAAPSPSLESETLADIDETLSRWDRPRLTPKERTAARTIDTAPTTGARDRILFGDAELWRSNVSKSLMTQTLALRVHNQSGRPVDDHRPPEWHERLAQLYAAMATWTRGDEPSLENYFRERAILLETLVALIPSGAERIRALGDLLAFLKSDGRQVFDDNMWSSRLRALMDACRNSPLEWEWVLRALSDSGDPVMRLYAQVEELSE